MKWLLELLRLFHMIVGITPARPEQERAFLLLWAGSILLILLIGIGLAVFLGPKILE